MTRFCRRTSGTRRPGRPLTSAALSRAVLAGLALLASTADAQNAQRGAADAGLVERIKEAVIKVFAAPAYVVLATVLATVTLLLAVWLPNLGLIGRVLSGSDAPLADTLRFTLSLLGGIGTNFSALSATYTVAIAVLFAVITAMIAYLFTKKRAAAAGRNIAPGSGGMGSGVLGIGCTACSSLALQGALPLAGAAAALAALPLRGAEFGILGVALLLASLLLASRAIARPKGCALARGGPS